MSGQKKINLSALNKTNFDENNNQENENKELKEENIEKKKVTNKKVTERMKKIINGDFIAKTEEDAENKIKEWKEEALEETKNNENKIKLPTLEDNKEIEQKQKEITLENKNNENKIKLPTLEDNKEIKQKQEEIIPENKNNENIISFDGIEKNDKKDEEIELFSNYKSDFEKLAETKVNEELNKKNNQNKEEKDSKININPIQIKDEPIKIHKKRNYKKLFFWLIILITILGSSISLFLFKDQIKEKFFSKKVEIEEKIEKEENIKNSIDKETIEIKGIKFEVDVISNENEKLYKYDGKEFKNIEELKDFLGNIADNKIKEEKIKKQKELNEKIKEKIRKQYLKND